MTPQMDIRKQKNRLRVLFLVIGGLIAAIARNTSVSHRLSFVVILYAGLEFSLPGAVWAKEHIRVNDRGLPLRGRSALIAFLVTLPLPLSIVIGALILSAR